MSAPVNPLDEINHIKRLCILNFLEIQELRRRLNIPADARQDHYDYANSVGDYLKELDSKMRNLIKDYPHLWDGKP